MSPILRSWFKKKNPQDNHGSTDFTVKLINDKYRNVQQELNVAFLFGTSINPAYVATLTT